MADTARSLVSTYGRMASVYPSGRKRFIVSDTTGAMYNELNTLFPVDEDGVPRLYTSMTSALAACTAGNGDGIYLAPDFTTALTAAELLSAETKGVTVVSMSEGLENGMGVIAAYRATATLPQTTHASIFTITGRVKLIDIVGTVTTAIQTQANNTKLTVFPTAAGLASVDICSVLDITADAVGTVYGITGTFATALVGASNGAAVYQAAPVILEAGALHLDCAASNTGSVKWAVHYIPLDPGARMIAA